MSAQRKKILVADDMANETPEGEKRSSAVRLWASIIAQRLHRPLKIVHVEDLTLYPVSHPVYRKFVRSWISDRKARLKKLDKALGGNVQTSMIEGYPAEKLIQLASKKSLYEMLVLGTHGRKGAERLFLGSVAEEVIRHSQIPVFTVGPNAVIRAPMRPDSTPRILLATDLSSNSKNAEAYALFLAKQLSAEVILFHSLLGGFRPVLQPAFSAGDIGREYWNMVNQVRPQADQELQVRSKAFARNKIHCQTRVDTKSLIAAAGMLEEVQEQKADLVVMGTHGRSLLSGAFFGNTARQMILQSPVPVITVRSRR